MTMKIILEIYKTLKTFPTLLCHWCHIPMYCNRSAICDLKCHQYGSVVEAWRTMTDTKVQGWQDMTLDIWVFTSSSPRLLLRGDIGETVTSARNQNLMLWEFKVIPSVQAITFNMCFVSYSHMKESFLLSALKTLKHPDRKYMCPFFSSKYNCLSIN